MTITPEQLDELEKRAQAVKDAERAAAQAFSIGEVEPQLRARAALREARAAHGPGNSPDVTLQLVAIARAALAWKDAKARCDSTDIRTDGSSAFVALIRTHEQLLAALEGTP